MKYLLFAFLGGLFIPAVVWVVFSVSSPSEQSCESRIQEKAYEVRKELDDKFKSAWKKKYGEWRNWSPIESNTNFK